MSKLFYTVSIALLLVACGPDTNTILYNEVMDIHDKVMPRMEDLYNKKKGLQEELKAADSTSKAAIEGKIRKIDSASSLMMTWMHEFNPPDKNAGKEQTKAYLEAELVKVKAMQDAVLEVLNEK